MGGSDPANAVLAKFFEAKSDEHHQICDEDQDKQGNAPNRIHVSKITSPPTLMRPARQRRASVMRDEDKC